MELEATHGTIEPNREMVKVKDHHNVKHQKGLPVIPRKQYTTVDKNSHNSGQN